MTNKIEISRELAERIVKDGVISVAQLDQLRALLAANPEENVACPQCGGSLRTWGCTCTPRWPMYKPEIAAPAVERQEPVAWVNDQQLLLCSKSPLEDQPNNPMMHNLPRNIAGSALRTDYCNTPLYTSPPAPVAATEKYDDVLLPFLALMRSELHANAHKGDRPGWLQMDSKTAILEVFYHMGKLHQAVHRGEEVAIKEYAADVANMCMMLLDVCACLDKVKEMNQ